LGRRVPGTAQRRHTANYAETGRRRRRVGTARHGGSWRHLRRRRCTGCRASRGCPAPSPRPRPGVGNARSRAAAPWSTSRQSPPRRRRGHGRESTRLAASLPQLRPGLDKSCRAAAAGFARKRRALRRRRRTLASGEFRWNRGVRWERRRETTLHAGFQAGVGVPAAGAAGSGAGAGSAPMSFSTTFSTSSKKRSCIFLSCGYSALTLNEIST